MSKRYPGGIITKSPTTPTGPYENGTAPGIWTLDQQLQYAQQGIWPTAGLVPNYIEDVFSTYLYTGNDTTQTITNGINLSTNGGMVWIKPRNQVQNHVIFDTVGGITKSLATNNTNAQYTATGGNEGLASFNTTGFTAKLYQDSTGINNSGCNLASWTFRKQPKFFDVVTYTGNGANPREIAHSLNSAPGLIIVKNLSAANDWAVWQQSFDLNEYDSAFIKLNSNLASTYSGTPFPSQLNVPTRYPSQYFYVFNNALTNTNGQNYVAYLFATNAGGFGLTGTDNVISCGSYTSNGSTISVNLGWEPQWILIKRTSNTGNWNVTDNMRGMTAATANASAPLFPNLSDAELDASSTNGPAINATGFTVPYSSSAFNYPSGETYIYMAIRRGPMEVPTLGTSVFSPIATTGDPSNVNVGFPTDLYIENRRDGASSKWTLSRLTGGPQYLSTNTTNAEATYAGTKFDLQNFFTGAALIGGSASIVSYMFGRAPSFFDEVCYTGTGSDITLTHNLQAVPQLMIFKERNNGTAGWFTFFNFDVSNFRQLYLNRDDSDFAAYNYNAYYLTAAPTSTSVFAKADSGFGLSVSARTYVAYLFATCAGVSKVGSYTGNGTTQTIDCGFTGGARFVLIKRYGTSAPNSGWYVYDTARGMTVLTDPYSFFSLGASEVATLGSVTTVATGFALNSAILADINVSAGTYIFLAIA